eukprot:CAMPEP_0119146776 /NCGR_PEP_ID=MMETSP1310-20130426/39417_1 /TAXON_ID=464262 /ORGANISM="Genus nov. species nov., Strain RCC2339" /LENGTH=187 /DNA_ID=CAMNT_0007138693 /DNA_START=54 /DNA_END=613 /DNA_ORIENTATION=+
MAQALKQVELGPDSRVGEVGVRLPGPVRGRDGVVQPMHEQHRGAHVPPPLGGVPRVHRDAWQVPAEHDNPPQRRVVAHLQPGEERQRPALAEAAQEDAVPGHPLLLLLPHEAFHQLEALVCPGARPALGRALLRPLPAHPPRLEPRPHAVPVQPGDGPQRRGGHHHPPPGPVPEHARQLLPAAPRVP